MNPMTAAQNEKATRFHTLHGAPGAFVIPNPWDVGSARVLAGLGFEALATSSAAAASAVGRRDGSLTRDEALAHARSIVNATDLPVSADLEKGFGNAPEVVAETIRLAAEAGLVGCTIEDATGDQTRPLYDTGLAVERIAAAAQAAHALPFPFCPDCARTTCFTLMRAWTKPSLAFRLSKRRGRMCFSPPVYLTLLQWRRFVQRYLNLSISWWGSNGNLFP